MIRFYENALIELLVCSDCIRDVARQVITWIDEQPIEAVPVDGVGSIILLQFINLRTITVRC
jgi:hypothetical protein